jgi:hypothetical protein
MCRLSWNLGASTSWIPQGLSRGCFTFYSKARNVILYVMCLFVVGYYVTLSGFETISIIPQYRIFHCLPLFWSCFVHADGRTEIIKYLVLIVANISEERNWGWRFVSHPKIVPQIVFQIVPQIVLQIVPQIPHHRCDICWCRKKFGWFWQNFILQALALPSACYYTT